jgi:4-carboxymuconolactone decarboxylase
MPAGEEAGPADSVIADLKANKRPASMSPDDEVVYDFVTDLPTEYAVSDEFARSRQEAARRTVGRDLKSGGRDLCRRRYDPGMAEEGMPADEEPPFEDGEP